MFYRTLIILLLSITIINTSNAQEKSRELDNQVSLVFGLGQLTQQGFNIEGNLFLNRWIFEYSHGVSLNLSNNQLEDGFDKEQGLAIHLPWTTGFGIGYRFNHWLNLRVEPKWHAFELYYNGDTQNIANRIGQYTTFTLGLGLYANIRPFKHQGNFLKGIMIVPNFRWWPQISSSLDNNRLSYFNKLSETDEVHQAREIGIGNTAFFGNISIGYSLTF